MELFREMGNFRSKILHEMCELHTITYSRNYHNGGPSGLRLLKNQELKALEKSTGSDLLKRMDFVKTK